MAQKNDLRKKVVGVAKNAAQKAEAEMKKLEKNLQDARKKATQYLKSNPEKAAAIAAGVGAAVGAALALVLRGKKKK